MSIRRINTLGLLLTSVSAILGSGWLFSAYYAAKLAGSASLIAWCLGGLMITCIALTFAEVCVMVPIMGSSTRIPHLTHGSLVSFVFAWIIWLGYQALGPAEVQAIMQYLSVYYPQLLTQQGGLTSIGLSAAAVILFVVSVFNVFSLKWLLRLNNVMTCFKVIIPLGVAGVFLVHSFSWHNLLHPTGQLFSPFGMKGVFAAISSGGLVFAFHGFKLAAEMGGEVKNPAKAIPVAIIGSIAVCLLLYLLLQSAFLTSLSSNNLQHGWEHLTLRNHLGPFAAIAQGNHFDYLIPIILTGAIIGPFAAALVYVGSAARSLYGMSENKCIPHFFSKLTGQGHPLYGIVIYFFLALCFFLPFKGWREIVTFLTALLALTYAIMPVCCYTLRDKLPNFPRPFQLKAGKLMSVLSFYACTLMVYWSGWPIVSKTGVVIGIGLCVFFLYRASLKHYKPLFDTSQFYWLVVYLLGIILFSYVGNYGGQHWLSPLYLMVTLFFFCLFIIVWAAQSSFSGAIIQRGIEQSCGKTA